ncbi:MAG: thymidylate synthase [Thermomicrobiales bacterium]|nr:thymidylate synthase [Thermomicrobiales bacterium]
MLSFKASTADSAWRQLASCLRAEGEEHEGRDQPTRELLHVGFGISDPRQRLVFARSMNPAFAVAEVIWMLAGFDDVDWLAWWNPRVRRLAADEGNPAFHGAYGNRLGSRPNIKEELARSLRHQPHRSRSLDQLKTAAETLQRDPTSRQVVLQIWDAERDLPNPLPRSRDIPCNLVSHLLIRDGRLEWLQVMRSNDIIWGLPYNLVQFTTLQEIMAGWIGVGVGSYQHLSNSLHIYKRHWQEFDALDLSEREVPLNSSSLRVDSYDAWQGVFARVVQGANELMHETEAEQLLSVKQRYLDLPPAYREWIALLTAEAISRIAGVQAASTFVQDAGRFWTRSWLLWAESDSRRRKSAQHG